MENSIQSEWVIGVYKGKKGEVIKALADAGTAYFVRSESGRGATYELEVAFRRVCDSPRPEYLLAATNNQANILEVMRKKRQQIIDRY